MNTSNGENAISRSLWFTAKQYYLYSRVETGDSRNPRRLETPKYIFLERKRNKNTSYHL